MQFAPLEHETSLQLALLLLPARWQQRVIGPVGLGMVPRSACRTETMGIPAVPDRASRPVGPGTVSYFAAFCLQNLNRGNPGCSQQALAPRVRHQGLKSCVRRWCLKDSPQLSYAKGLLAVHTVARESYKWQCAWCSGLLVTLAKKALSSPLPHGN